MNRRLIFCVTVLFGGLFACATPPRLPVQVPAVIVSTLMPTATTASQPTEILGADLAPIAVPSPTPPAVPQWQNPLDENMQETAVSYHATFHQLQPTNSGAWQYDTGSFWHPIALAANGQTAFMLDGGRVLTLALANATPPALLLKPGDFINDLLVQEPLDLALVDGRLLVLDRTGDVYALDLASGVWQLERYERPIGETSSHYFVALGHDTTGGARRLRLETSYGYAQYYFPDDQQRLWSLPEEVQPVDVSGVGDQIYVLWHNGDGSATVALFQETARLTQFAPTVAMVQPRQIVATQTAVYVLDRAGRRLLSLQPQTGELQAIFQLPAVTAFAASPDGAELMFVGRDRLYFWQQPNNNRFVQGGPNLAAPQPHDAAMWQTLAAYTWPISGNHLDLTPRDLQMPGAPRHYRLGVHEGTDFYWANGTPVYAAAAGKVIRATLDYERPSETIFNRRRAENLELGYTTPDNLDFYRGQQLWILQEDGLVARYAHLSEIVEGIVEGTAVSAGQQIGLIGNSGSPASINSETADAHLHFELWLGEAYLGQFLRPIETRELLEKLFTP